MAGRVTTEQLLNLADRAECGPLTAAEASRLRAGISQLHEGRQSLRARLRAQSRRLNGADAELRAVHGLIARAEERGDSRIPLWAVAAVIEDEPHREAA